MRAADVKVGDLMLSSDNTYSRVELVEPGMCRISQGAEPKKRAVLIQTTSGQWGNFHPDEQVPCTSAEPSDD